MCEDIPCGDESRPLIKLPPQARPLETKVPQNISQSTVQTCKEGWTHWINSETPDEEDPEDVEIIGETTPVQVNLA